MLKRVKYMDTRFFVWYRDHCQRLDVRELLPDRSPVKSAAERLTYTIDKKTVVIDRIGQFKPLWTRSC